MLQQEQITGDDAMWQKTKPADRARLQPQFRLRMGLVSDEDRARNVIVSFDEGQPIYVISPVDAMGIAQRLAKVAQRGSWKARGLWLIPISGAACGVMSGAFFGWAAMLGDIGGMSLGAVSAAFSLFVIGKAVL